MLLSLGLVLGSLAMVLGSQMGQNGFMTKDWPKQDLVMTGEVVFTINAPQFRGRRRRFDVTIGLFGNHVPYTVANFAQLAAGGVLVSEGGGKGKDARRSSGSRKPKTKTLSYRDTPFHRLDKDISIQGGDAVFKDGTGSITIYNSTAMSPENFVLSNYGKGWVGMLHNGYQSNFSIGCQFYICMTNNRSVLHNINQQPYVIFGKVIKGMDNLERINGRIKPLAPGQRSGRNSGDVLVDASPIPGTGENGIPVIPLNKPVQEIKITGSRFKAYPKKRLPRTTNRPSTGSLFGSWPKPEGEKQQ